MMGLFYIALWQLMIVTTITNVEGIIEHDTLNLQVNIGDVSKVLHLTRVDRVLANTFVPVWITKVTSCLTFVKTNIMNKLGEFTMYHDYCTKSAFVYFHDRGELDGIIDVTYYVKRFPIKHTKKVQLIKSKYLHHVGSNDATSRLIRSINETMKHRTYRDVRRTVYPEVLVALSYDIYMNIKKDVGLPRGIATVSHVLTVYNAVDMLYSRILKDDIQLNIAGIVIESKPNQWGFESKDENAKLYINGDNIHKTVSDFFWKHENTFPRHSYDLILFHSSKFLVGSDAEGLLGQAMITTGESMFQAFVKKDRFNAVVQDFPTYEHFSTIAHEIAHLFGADHDGKGDYGKFFDINTCGKTLMADAGHCSESCLNWSKQTEEELSAFFRTPVYCSLKNYPRSLGTAEPKVIFSKQEQCECLGHKFSEGPATDESENDCNWPLTCMSNSNSRMVYGPLPMDGTPCAQRKVCWNLMCVDY